jgi:hypothetical protein
MKEEELGRWQNWERVRIRNEAGLGKMKGFTQVVKGKVGDRSAER